jgi:hypothetical protein
VSSRLRPWIDVTIAAVACHLDEGQAAFDFDVELLNSGAAPAREVLLEARLFNAGPTQEQDIGAFMTQPVGQGERIALIAPLQRANFHTSLAVPRAGLQLFELGGREVFVPVIAFNALYRWSGGEGQTSASYLLGRETGAEKLAPLRADLGARTIGGLGTRPLPTGLRR